MSRQGLERLKEVDGITYYRFRPSLGHWYYEDYPGCPKHGASHWVRMLLEYLQAGYSVIYPEDADGRILGYITVVRGGSRLRCSTKRDIVLGPIWILPKARGKGYGTKGIHAVLHDLDVAYENAYEYIKPTNIASIRSVEKNGYENIGYAKESGLMRRLTLCGEEKGPYLIYRFRNPKTDA